MGQNQWLTIASAINHFDDHHVCDQLSAEVEKDETPQHLIRDLVPGLEYDKQQWSQIIDNGLRDVSGVARSSGMVKSHTASTMTTLGR
jgi:hypothetical protein